jgi:S-methylmethionine-dependent homocysteine/selenocysteine methylase
VHLNSTPTGNSPARWQTRLAAGEVVIIDGGTGSEIRRRGVALDATAWSAIANLDHADLVTDIHCDYLAAGADVITANTFAGSRFVLAAAGLADRFTAVNAGALAAAHQARERTGRADAAIATSLSCLPPRFDPGAWPAHTAALAAYRELVALFVDHGAEVIILEMMQEPVQARLAAQAAMGSGLPVWLGLSCRANAAGALVGYDFPSVLIDDTLNALLDLNFALLAIMHSPPAAIVPALQHLRRRWPGPLGAWAETRPSPDAALSDATVQAGDDEATSDTPFLTAAEYAEAARHWVQAGAQLLGGCCGTTPAHIAALRATWPISGTGA